MNMITTKDEEFVKYLTNYSFQMHEMILLVVQRLLIQPVINSWPT